jgi:hypothetical protein
VEPFSNLLTAKLNFSISNFLIVVKNNMLELVNVQFAISIFFIEASKGELEVISLNSYVLFNTVEVILKLSMNRELLAPI